MWPLQSVEGSMLLHGSVHPSDEDDCLHGDHDVHPGVLHDAFRDGLRQTIL